MSDTAVNRPDVRQGNLLVLRKDTQAPTAPAVETRLLTGAETVARTEGALALKQPIAIDRLWEAAHGESANVVRALELLKESSDYLSQARQNENPTETDRLVQRAQLLLPKLFALRSISDGFGLLVNSLYYASVNLRGTPMHRNQLDCVWRTLRELRARPVMSVEQAIERVEELEESGLEPDPPELGDLLDNFESTEDA